MKNTNLLTLIAITTAIYVSGAFASPSSKINYQGRLQEGETLTTGVVGIEFRIYDAVVSGTQLWSSGEQQITVLRGIFDYHLGQNTAFSDGLFDSSPLYLEIVVEGNVMSPREEIVASPYSISAGNAQKLGNVAASLYATSAEVLSATTNLLSTSSAALTYVNVSGDIMTGNLDMGHSYKIVNLSTPTANLDAATKIYVDSAVSSAGADNLGNHTATTNLNMSGNAITNIDWATSDDGAGSELDADLLDGLDSTAFQLALTTASWAAYDSNRLGGVAASLYATDAEVAAATTSAVVPYLAKAGGAMTGAITSSQSRLEISTNVYIVGYSSATAYYGDGSNLTGISGGIGDVVLASTQTFTGQNTFLNQVTVSSGTTISGNVGIGTNSPRTRLELGNDGGILALGTFGSGWTEPNIGAGTRMLWYPRKAAFRAGYVDGTQWDDANIGDFSAAMGYGTTASGIIATAMGGATTASGDYSTAMGVSSTASGDYSTAMGWDTTASGGNSTAMGYGTTASGDVSTAMGYGTTASAYGSTAMGYGTTASGQHSTAMGYNTTASDFASTAMGFNSVASGIYSFAAGRKSSATAQGAFAISDSEDAQFLVNTTNGFGARFAGGYKFTGGSVEISSNVYITGISSAAAYYGDGSNLTGISGSDNLGNHTATADLDLANNAITNIDWSTSDDGEGSGLDADLLDGLDSTAFQLQLTTTSWVAYDSNRLGGAAASVYATDAEVAAATTSAVVPYLAKAGGTMTGAITSSQSQLEISTNVYIVGYSSAAAYYGDGSNLTGISGGDAYLASTQTFTGQNTFLNQVTISSGTTISGNVGIGTNSPRTRLELGNDGGILALGTYNSGWTEPDLGGGTRLMWYPRKAAFRAGYVTGTQWNNANIGNYSVAMGEGTTASGTQSTAMGWDTTASGTQSTAMGNNTTASGYSSTAMGYYTTASGDISTAMGVQTTASAYGSTAMGMQSVASGSYSFAAGRKSSATAQGAFAISDSEDAQFLVNTTNGFGARFAGGYRFTGGNVLIQSTMTVQGNAFSVGGSTLVVTGGNVGIGTDNPDELLHLKHSDSTAHPHMLKFENSAAGGGYYTMGVGATGATTAAASFFIGNDIAYRFVIASNGNVGIGNNTKIPAYKLDVDGDIRALGSVYYGGSGGNANGNVYNKPDFVFEEGYKALTTDEVETFLKEKGHLPWLTSAKQDLEENNGAINMTRMNFETVETAENLQLQIIELQKTVKVQQEIIDKLVMDSK